MLTIGLCLAIGFWAGFGIAAALAAGARDDECGARDDECGACCNAWNILQANLRAKGYVVITPALLASLLPAVSPPRPTEQTKEQLT